ncbi:CDK-activating kinase assembly factor [Thozetella sp. PMI_491]|nr:CDK-activating kinase assembly factor [Thozetella sp. PMI_491]
MSRKASLSSRPLGASSSSALSAINAEDMCPVCKTIRYLNKDMEFLINPECYHPMCSNCVNRLFGDNPNQCPYAGCHKTLRRKGFRSAFFGDLGVEREVDIRRRVTAVFNQVEDDFESLRAYNDYLQMVEDLTFDLCRGKDTVRLKAEADLQQWEAEHRAQIERNRKAGRDADERTRRRLQEEKEAARRRHQEALEEVRQEKEARERAREEDLNNLAAGLAPSQVQLKRRGQTTRVAAQQVTAADTAADVGRLSIRGLKEKKKPLPSQGPYDPFGGLDYEPTRYTLHPSSEYHSEALDKFRRDPRHTIGGYSFTEYTTRALFEAFSGLGVFIEDEKEAGIGLSAGEVATIGAGIAAAGDRMEIDGESDVFG